MSIRVSSDHTTNPMHHVPKGNDGKKTPPPSSPHQSDSISSSSTSSQGFIGKFFSPVTYIMSLVLGGFSYCCSLIRWPFEKLGILTPKESEAPAVPTKSLEEQKQDLLEAFSKGSHSDRLHLLVYKIASWPGDAPEELFIELFNKQDQEVIEALNDEVFEGVDWGEEAETELPMYLYRALHARDRNSDQESCVDKFRQFLLEFPDYAIKYAASCFEPETPAYSHFRALEILASHRGRTQVFHVEEIDGQDELDAIRNAFVTHFKSLSIEEQCKLVGLVSESHFIEIDKELIENLKPLEKNEEVVRIFETVDGYKTSSNFVMFMHYLLTHDSREWRRVREELFHSFPELRHKYVEAKTNMFVDLRRDDIAHACLLAYETTPAIFKGRLEVLVQSEKGHERTRANEKLLNGNTSAAVRLFYLYKERFLGYQVSLYQKDPVEAEVEFKETWQGCFDFDSGRITRHEDFVREMLSVENDSAYRRAAGDLLAETFGPA